MLEYVAVTCPSCWEPVTLEIDLSIESQDYIEDCSVCCAPMRVIYHAANGEVDALSVEATQ